MGYANFGEYRVTLGFIGGIGATELVLILLLVLVLFGARKIPELAKGLGSGLREFKKAASEIESAGDAKTSAQDQTSTSTAALASTRSSETLPADDPAG